MKSILLAPRSIGLFCLLSIQFLGYSASAKKGRIEVPINIGVGPAVNILNGGIFEDQALHYALKLDLFAVIDKKTIRKNKNRIPKTYRRYANSISEVRFSPYWFIPNILYISPRYANTGLYGLNFRPLAVGIPIVNNRWLGARFGAGLNLTYLYIHSNKWDDTHFVRPGVDLKADFEFKISKKFLMSLGWASHFYPPQRLGGTPIDFAGGVNGSLWHIGQAYLMFHGRVPYRVRL